MAYNPEHHIADVTVRLLASDPEAKRIYFVVGTGMQARCEKSRGSGDAVTASFISWKTTKSCSGVTDNGAYTVRLQ